MCGSGSELAEWRDSALRFESALNQCVLGLERAIRLLTIAIFARGHVLLEGNVGVGKTTLLRAAARGLGGDYERVEGHDRPDAAGSRLSHPHRSRRQTARRSGAAV